MKQILQVVLLIVVAAGIIAAGYLASPYLIEKHTAPLQSDVKSIQERLQNLEKYVSQEKQARESGALKPDADLQRTIQMVNTLSERLSALQDSQKKDSERFHQEFSAQLKEVGQTLKSQADTLNAARSESTARMKEIAFDSSLANIRAHILKIRLDMASRNLETTRNELDLVDAKLIKLQDAAAGQQQLFADILQSLRRAKTEVNENLPAAVNRIDLIWHETGKLKGKYNQEKANPPATP